MVLSPLLPLAPSTGKKARHGHKGATITQGCAGKCLRGGGGEGGRQSKQNRKTLICSICLSLLYKCSQLEFELPTGRQ